MKKIMTALFIIFMMVFASGCFNEEKTEKKSETAAVATTGGKTTVTFDEKIAGIEFEIDRAVEAADISGNNGNLVITKNIGGKTFVAVAVKNTVNGAVFTINNSDKYGPMSISIKEKIASVNEAVTEKAVKRAGEKLLGDFNGDDTVNVIDFNLFATNYYNSYNSIYDVAPAQKSIGDWSGIYSFVQADGKVNILDFVIFGENYGKSNPVVTVTSVVITKPLSFTGSIEKGKTATLGATATYSNNTTSTDVVWASDNESVATVTKGIITAVGAGTAKITASKGGKSDSVDITVTIPSTAITIYIEKPDTWSEVWIWYKANAKAAWDTITLKTAPGDMVNYRTGWYKKVLAETDTSVEFLFNDGTWNNKLCAEGFNKGSTAANYKTTKSVWITKDGKTWDVDPVGPKAPGITLSPASFTKPAGTYTVDVSVAANEGTMESVKYTLDGSDPASSGTAKTLSNTGGQVSVTLTTGGKTTLKVYAKNNIGSTTAEGIYTEGEIQTSTFSWNNATVYFVLTDRFHNGNSANDESYGRKKSYGTDKLNTGTFHGGDIAGLTAKLNEGYFTNLGVNAIWVTAPYEQIHGWCGGKDNLFPHYAYHGYYALDFTEMDQNMGTIEEFRTFVDTAHSKGIRVVVDVVMNHVGYNTVKDMVQYGFGKWKSGTPSENWEPSNKDSGWSLNDLVDYTSGGGWDNWWGKNWTRTGMYGNEGSGDLTGAVGGLPDLITEQSSSVGLPPLLINKWAKETTGYDKWIVPAAKDLRKDIGVSPITYEVKWLAAWVREFGIDGFRCDTAKHISADKWAQLKAASKQALTEWRNDPANASKPESKWTDSFWMTGEVWGHGADRSSYYDNGFDSMINFNYMGTVEGSVQGAYSNIEGTYSGYAAMGFNPLSYISSHDTIVYYSGGKSSNGQYGFGRGTVTNDQQKKVGTLLLLNPKAVQIYYGDENGREKLTTGISDVDQMMRSDIKFGDKADILTHWQKVGQFRNRHIAVGAGTHTKISDSPYTFSRVKDDDKVICVLGASGSTTITVPSNIFADGTAVKDAYSGNTGTVSGGKVTITAASDILLIEKQ